MATIRWRGKEEDYAHLCWCVNGVENSMPLGRISAAEAERSRKAKEVELETGQKLFFAAKPFTEFRTEYLDWHALTYPDSHFRVKQILEGEPCDAFVSKALSQVTNMDIDLWKAKRMNRIGRNRRGKVKKVSRSTALKEYSTVRALFSKAVEWKSLAVSPFEECEQPKLLKSAPPHWYRTHELAVIYKGTDLVETNYGDVWKFMAATGVRRAEALGLLVENVDLVARVLHVLSSEDDEDEEGGGRTKSGKWREIPLNDNAMEAVKQLIRKYGDTKYVLPRITGPSLSRAFARDIEHLGLKGSLHSLRHSYGSHMIKHVTLRELKDFMGHARIETTMIYLHVDDDDTKARARAANF